MKRTLQVLALALAALVLPQTGHSQTVMLRDSVMVTDEVVRLGDLFSNAGPKAEAAVAYAPAPGKRAVFDARWLWRVAYAYGLQWQPMSMRDRAVVERDSQTIGTEAIEDSLRTSLLDRGMDPDSVVELSNRGLRLYVPGNASATVAVQDLQLDERNGRFSAMLVAPADDPKSQPIRVTGMVQRQIEVPVLKDTVRNGAIIRNSDIQWIKVRADRVARDAILDTADLVGKSAKRTARPGYPLRSADVQLPILVEKGAIVSMILRSGSMTLTAKGTALERGGQGATIRVTNTRSNAIVEARVVGTDVVVVDMAAKIASKVE